MYKAVTKLGLLNSIVISGFYCISTVHMTCHTDHRQGRQKDRKVDNGRALDSLFAFTASIDDESIPCLTWPSTGGI